MLAGQISPPCRVLLRCCAAAVVPLPSVAEVRREKNTGEPPVKRTEPSPELGGPDGWTRHGTDMCHRHGMCDQDGMGHRDRTCHRDGMCHRELFGTIHLRPSFRSSAPKAGVYFFTRFRPFHSCHHCGVACLHVSGVMRPTPLSPTLLRSLMCI